MMFILVSMGRAFVRLAIIVAVVTALGQVPFKGKSLENHYHDGVNSGEFQTFFWALATPVTWTAEKVADLFQKTSEPLAR